MTEERRLNITEEGEIEGQDIGGTIKKKKNSQNILLQMPYAEP